MTGAPVIAIDGPAASGKSSTARAVAEQLGLAHLDSGALYRVAAWLAARHRVEADALPALLDRHSLVMTRCGAAVELRLDGAPVEPAIRSAAVTERVSQVAAVPAVRAWVDRQLRQAVSQWGGAVMDGRDIGTVVFPDAVLKVFLTASPEARARRRLTQADRTTDVGALAAEAARLSERDRRDAGRALAPLRQAPDALLLDTTGLSFAEQVEWIVARARSALARTPG